MTITNFIVKQNGVTRLSVTETTSFGASYRNVGVGAKAANRVIGQTVSADLEMWAAADRLKTSV